MNIVQESTGALEAVLNVELTEEDYRDKVAAELKNMQKKAQMPGFRPGKVPMGMIQKMYGRGVLVEEVNKILADAVYKYITDNKLNILGNPVPDHAHAAGIDWEKETSFTFKYHIGLAPEISLEFSEEIEVPYHRIQVADDMVDSYLQDIRKRGGKTITPGSVEEEDVLFGEFLEVDQQDQPVTDGKVNKTNLYVQYIKDEELKKSFLGAKAGQAFLIELDKAVGGNQAEAAAMIGIKKEELAEVSPWFRFTIDSISRVEPAELNEELFEKVVPGKEIKTEEAFREELRSQISTQYQVDVDKHFRNEARTVLLERTEIPLPEAFLKTWLVDANRDEFTPEQIEKEFPQFLESFKWQLLENHLIKTHQLEVKNEEVHAHLSDYFRAQMRQYGQEDLEQDVVDGFVKNIMAKEEEAKKVYDRLYEDKLTALFKEKLKLNETELKFEEFVALMNEKYKPHDHNHDHDHDHDHVHNHDHDHDHGHDHDHDHDAQEK